MKQRHKKGSENLVIRTANFITLLKQVYLGGTVDDIVATINGKVCSIEAVDLSNSLIITTSSVVFKKKSKNDLLLGFGNINSLIKFFDTIKEPIVNAHLDENKLVFIRKDKRRQMKYLLSDPSMIASVLEKDDPEEDTTELFLGMQEYKVVLSREIMQDFHSYIGLSGSKITEIAYSSDNNITITIGSDIEHQFSLETDNEIEDVDGNGEDFSLKINGDFLNKIFSVIEIDEDDPPQLWIGESKPVLITNKGTIWALSPSAENETGIKK